MRTRPLDREGTDRGFTLPELLISIVVMGTIAPVLIDGVLLDTDQLDAAIGQHGFGVVVPAQAVHAGIEGNPGA